MRGSTDISGGIDIILFPMQISKKSKRPFAHFLHNSISSLSITYNKLSAATGPETNEVVISGSNGLWNLALECRPGEGYDLLKEVYGGRLETRIMAITIIVEILSHPGPSPTCGGSTMAPLNGGEDLDLGHISPLSNPLWAGHTIVWAHNLSKKCGPVICLRPCHQHLLTVKLKEEILFKISKIFFSSCSMPLLTIFTIRPCKFRITVLLFCTWNLLVNWWQMKLIR